MSQHYRRACCCGGDDPFGGVCCYPSTPMRARMSTYWRNTCNLNGTDVVSLDYSVTIDATLQPVFQNGIVVAMRSTNGTASYRSERVQRCFSEYPFVGSTCPPAVPADCPPCTGYRLDFREVVTAYTNDVADAISIACQQFCADNRKTNVLDWSISTQGTRIYTSASCTESESTETNTVDVNFGHRAYGRGGCLNAATFSDAYIPLLGSPLTYCSGFCVPFSPNVQECGDGARMGELFSDQICGATSWPPPGGFSNYSAYTCPATACTRAPFECVNLDCFGNPTVTRCGCDMFHPYAGTGIWETNGWGDTAIGTVSFALLQYASATVTDG